MNLLVFGAAGATGRHVLTLARDAGHNVIAFIRTPAPLAVDGITVVTGDATDAAAVAAAMPSDGAVICTLGVRNTARSGHLMARSLGTIVSVMERKNTKRLIVMSALGVGKTREHAPWLPRLMYAMLLRDIFRDKEEGERIVRASSLNWTIVRPPLLTNGPLSENYRVGTTLALAGFPKISRASVAHFMVNAVSNREWNCRSVIVSD